MAYTDSRVTIVGNLVADAEVRQLDGDKTVANGRVAVNMKLGKKEYTNFFSFSIWDGFAKAVGPLLKKGDKVYLHGPLELKEYEGKNGKGIDAIVHPDTLICLGDGRVSDGDLGPVDPEPRKAASGASPFGNRRR